MTTKIKNAKENTTENDVNYFAKIKFRNDDRIFGIRKNDRRRHIYIIGQTGTGKSTLLENMAINDIQNGQGVCFIDPHGDIAEKLLKAIPSNRINDVIYFNPDDREYPIAFNIMDSKEDKHLVASGIVGVFKKIWSDSWGPRLEDTLRNTLLALLDSNSTLLGVQRMLRDEAYRHIVVRKIKDPVVKAFWEKTFAKWNDRYREEAIAPIQNKVGQFLSSSMVRNIVGQEYSAFDLREVMDGKKILIVNLSKGKLGEDNSNLLGSMLITKLFLSAMSRQNIPEDERKDFYLYVDEFQNFATESFANILSEARKYKLSLILANQFIEQIKEEVRSAIFGNCGTLISFRIGGTDAEQIEKQIKPFIKSDFINLPNYHFYIRLMIDGFAGEAFSAVGLSPKSIEDTEANAEKIIKISRQRYCKPREIVEHTIENWSK